MRAVAPAEEPCACPHCGALVEQPGYCCSGCETAARIIAGAGAEAYYDRRTELPSRPAPSNVAWEAVSLEREGDSVLAELDIDGLRCASCVWVVERVLEATPGVEKATVSYATGRARLRWQGDAVELAEIASRIESLGYHPRPLTHAGQPDRDLLLRFGFAAFIAVNVMSLHAAVYAGWTTGMEERYLALFRWLSLALATPAVLWSAQPFFRGAWTGLRHGLLHMDVPISLGIAAMYLHGVVSVLTGAETWLDSATMLVALLLGGRVLESRGRRRAAEAAASLAAEVPHTARRVRDGQIEVVASRDLVPGDLIEVSSGEEFAGDGAIERGRGWVRMALLTGESDPVELAIGDEVIAGAVVVDGHMQVRVKRTGEETAIHAMAEAVRESTAQPFSAPTDAIAPWFTAATLLVAAATGVAWGVHGGAALGIERAVSVLVIVCPCALALSWPLAASAGVGAAARRGLLVRSPEGLLRLAEVEVVMLDKTGTLTEGELTVTDASDEVLRLAAGLERGSNHPIARAITAEAGRRGIPLPMPSLVSEQPGEGISGVVDGRRLTLRAGGPRQVVLLEGGTELGTLELQDRLRADAADAVKRLEGLGLFVEVVSGDRAEVTEAIAESAGLSQATGGVRPLDKQERVKRAQAAGRTVLFVGDGLNDAAALSSADVGISMHTGAVSSMLGSDAVVLEGALGPVVAGIRAAREARRAIRANITRSVAYNIVAGGLAVAGFVNPLVAAVSMPLSSLWVVWGASRVERQLQ